MSATELKNVKDMTPSEDAVTQLEFLLSEAKKGKLRSFYMVSQYENEAVAHSWSVDHRYGRRLLIAQAFLGLIDFTTTTLVDEGDSGFSAALERRDEL